MNLRNKFEQKKISVKKNKKTKKKKKTGVTGFESMTFMIPVKLSVLMISYYRLRIPTPSSLVRQCHTIL